VIALTFDDGPDAEHTPRILDLLAERDVRATFFVFGEKARRRPDLIARALEAGHAIQPHCWADHASHLHLSEDELEAEIARTLGTLAHLGCPAPALWRPPYGDIKEPESHAVAARHDLRIVTWTLDTRDWDDDGGALSLAEVDAQLRLDSVVLMHDPMPRTAALLAGLLDRIEARGLATGLMAV
jgi:peptidoglycan/xylan/chitin deacetylase (PgdA/CDA1 family)